MEEKELLAKVNCINRQLGRELAESADTSLYGPMVGTHGPAEAMAYEYDHTDRAEVPEWYAMVATQSEKVRSFSKVAEDTGFPLVTTDRLPHLKRRVPEKVIEWGKAYSGLRTPWLWITGGTGSGKTCAAAVAVGLAGQRVDRGEVRGGKFVFVTARDMTEIVDASGNYSGRDSKETKHERRDRWIGADLLVIDDLGLERHWMTSWETLSRILDARQAAKRPTVITCPYSGHEWFEMYGKVDSHERRRLKGRIGDALSGWTGDPSEALRHVADLTGGDMRLQLAG